jgi:hypothetical protein
VGTPASGIADPFDPDGVRFLFDENFAPGVGRAFGHAGFNARCNEDVGLKGADDLEVIEFCGRDEAVWVTQDIDARKRAAYADMVRKMGVSAVFLRVPRAKQGMSMKDRFALVARWMPWLEERLGTRRPRYFLVQTRGEPRELRHFAEKVGRRR